MLRKRFLESLTARIFVLTALILLGSGAATFGLIAWATPSTYTSVINDGLQKQVDSLVSLLKESSLEASGPLIVHPFFQVRCFTVGPGRYIGRNRFQTVS